VDCVLRKHEKSLRALYETYSFGEGGIVAKGELRSTKLLSVQDFLDLCKHFDLFDEFLAQRDGLLIFSWSRMRVANESALRSRVQLMHLTFEDFLEALVRLAAAKALPTDAEVKHAGCKDGGSFLLKLKADPDAFKEFQLQWSKTGPLPDRHLEMRQPIWRAVDHLLHFMVRAVERTAASKGGKDLVVTKVEAKKFRAQAGRAHLADEEVHPDISDGGGPSLRPATPELEEAVIFGEPDMEELARGRACSETAARGSTAQAHEERGCCSSGDADTAYKELVVPLVVTKPGERRDVLIQPATVR